MAKIKDKNREIVFNKLHDRKKLRGEWKTCTEKALKKFEGTEKGKLYKLHFEQHKAISPVCMELYISQRTFYSWRDEILDAVINQAMYDRLLEP